jgi:serine/threonine protein phosphatase PrpC
MFTCWFIGRFDLQVSELTNDHERYVSEILTQHERTMQEKMDELVDKHAAQLAEIIRKHDDDMQVSISLLIVSEQKEFSEDLQVLQVGTCSFGVTRFESTVICAVKTEL